MHPFSFAGEPLCALAERALYWPSRRALIVADLHLEKASWFASHGQMLPPFDSQATLERLVTLADHIGALEIWALGDSFHDSVGPGRLPDAALQLLDRLSVGRRMVWIAGNHDAAAALPGERVEEAEVDGLVLRHEASPHEHRPELSGHFHPKLRVKTAARSVSRPCFVMGANRLILPAFGSLTGGLDANHAAIQCLFGDPPEAMVATRAGLLRFATGRID